MRILLIKLKKKSIKDVEVKETSTNNLLITQRNYRSTKKLKKGQRITEHNYRRKLPRKWRKPEMYDRIHPFSEVEVHSYFSDRSIPRHQGQDHSHATISEVRQGSSSSNNHF